MKFIIALLVFVFAMVSFAKEAAKPTPTPAPVVKTEVKKVVKKSKAVVKTSEVVPDKPLSSVELAEVDTWIQKKVKSGAMTKKQGEDAMKHADALYKQMVAEKKPKKGAK